MNCDNCELPKNSFTAAITGRMLMMDCGVMVSDVYKRQTQQRAVYFFQAGAVKYRRGHR